MNIYYVYIYYCDKNIPFYVGYGKNKRMYDHIKEAKRSPNPTAGDHKLNKIRKILSEGLEPKVEIYASDLSREEACLIEISLIENIGRSDLGLGPLTNMTKGGDGTVDWSDELRQKVSEKRKGIISAKDKETGRYIQVKYDDPRWILGSLVGINHGEMGITNKNGRLDGYIISKNHESGEFFRVKKDDPRWISGELVGINKGKECHINTRIATSNRCKGVPKTPEENKKNSDSVKLLKWYCNFQIDKVKRCRENEQPEGYVRVSGPHTRKPI